MQAGWLRHRLTFQEKPPVARDSFGGEAPAWTDVVTLWGSIEPLRGREYLEGQQEQVDISHRVRVRYYPNIQAAMRIQYVDREGNTRYLDIENVVNPLERGKLLEIMCREAARQEAGV